MAATKLNVNWYAVSLGSTNFTKVTGLKIDNKGDLLSFTGDIDRFATVKINHQNDPMVTITSGDIASVRACPPGTRGTFAATLKDAKNQTASSAAGDITFAGVGGIVGNNPVSGSHKQFASGDVMVEFESTDGLTNPLSSTVA